MLAEQAGLHTLLLSAEELHSTGKVLHLQSKTAEWGLGYIMFADVQTCTQVATSPVFPLGAVVVAVYSTHCLTACFLNRAAILY